MRTTLWVIAVLGWLVSGTAAWAFPPFQGEGSEWSVSTDERVLTYTGTNALRVRLTLDLDAVRMSGMSVRVTTDAAGISMVAGRERVQIAWTGGDEAAELILGGRGASHGIRVDGAEVASARGAWIRMLDGPEASCVVEFGRATYVVIEAASVEAGRGGEEPPTEPDGAMEGEGEEEEPSAEERGERLTPEYVDGVPRIELVRDVAATRVYEAAQRLGGTFKCRTCSGTTQVEDYEVVGYEELVGGGRRERRRYFMRDCDVCAATGYRDHRTDRQFMDTFVERLVRADREHPRFDRGRREQWPEVLREILDINPGKTAVINAAAYERMRDAQDLPIGSSVWFIAQLDFDKPVWLSDREGRPHEYRSVLFSETNMVVLVTQPQIEHAISGKYCIVGGLLAGFAFADDPAVEVVPVLQGGFIVGR